MAKSGPRRPVGNDPSASAVRQALIAATVRVAGDDGFANTSARAVARLAGVAPGVIYYHFGSMDGLLVAAHDQLTSERLERIRATMAAADRTDWPVYLSAAIRAELEHPAGGAAIELTLGATGSDALAAAARRNTDRSIELIADLTAELIGDSPLAQLVEPIAVAEVAAAAFFGAAVLGQLGRPIDVDRALRPVAAIASTLGAPVA